MKRPSIQKLFFPVLAIILCTCSKENLFDLKRNFMIQQRSALPSVIDIMDLLNEPVDGYIFITSYGTYSIQSLRGPETMCQAVLLDKSGKSRFFGDLFLNAVELPFTFNTQANTQNQYGGNYGLGGAPALFDDTVDVSVAGTDSFPGLSVFFYSPPLITLKTPVYQNNDTLSFDNLLIEWTPDPLNENGIGILIQYDANDPDNVAIGGSSVVLSAHAEDDGDYTFTSQELSRIPNNGRAYLYIGRTNYLKVLMDDPDYSVGIYNYSVISHKVTFSE